jgi:hypothetical protein
MTCFSRKHIAQSTSTDFEFHDLAREDLAARGFIAGRPLDLRRRRLRDHIRHYGSIGNQGKGV